MVSKLKLGAWCNERWIVEVPVVVAGFFPCYCVNLKVLEIGRKRLMIVGDWPENALARFVVTRQRLLVLEVPVHLRLCVAFVDCFAGWILLFQPDDASSLETVHDV